MPVAPKTPEPRLFQEILFADTVRLLNVVIFPMGLSRRTSPVPAVIVRFLPAILPLTVPVIWTSPVPAPLLSVTEAAAKVTSPVKVILLLAVVMLPLIWRMPVSCTVSIVCTELF